MLYLSSFLFVVCFLSVAFLIGHLTLRALGLHGSALKALFLGAMAGVAVFQLIAYPMFRLSMPFTALFWLYALVLAGMCAYSLYLLICKRQYVGYVRQLSAARSLVRPHRFLVCVLGLVFVAFVLCQLCMRYTTTDATYYYPRAMEIIAQNNVGVTEQFAWLGWECPVWTASSDASTLEALRAWLSYASGIQATVLSKGALLFCFNVLSLCGIYEAVASLRKRDARSTAPVAAYTLLFYMLLVILFSSQRFGEERWVFQFGSQGKSLLCSLIVPGLLMTCADIFWDRGEKKGNWVCAAILLTAGISLSVVGAFLPVIFYFTLGGPILLQWKWKTAKKNIGRILLSLLPVVVFSGLTFLDVITRNHEWLALGTPSWTAVFKDQMGWYHCFQLALYLLALLYIGLRGPKAARWMLIGSPILLFLTFLNPLFTEIVAKYVTTGVTYWRLYWLVPCSLVIAYGAAELIDRSGQEKASAGLKGAIAALAVIVGIGVGLNGPAQYVHWILNEYQIMNLYGVRTNVYSIEDVYVEVADAVLADYDGQDRPRIYDPTLFIHGMIRQYSVDVQLACGLRPEQTDNMREPVRALGMTQGEFFKAQYEQIDPPDVQTLALACQEMSIDYLCVPQYYEYLPENAEAFGFERIATCTGWYDVWRCPRD